MNLKSILTITKRLVFVCCTLLLWPTCQDDSAKEDTGLPPVANFSAAPTQAEVNQPVQFTDQSTNTPTSWLWDFGDGGTSMEQNPEHIYDTAGSYTVSLKASNSYGSHTKTSSADYITISASTLVTGTVTDIDGNVYKTVIINDQEWMAENLKTTRFNDGTPIPLVTDHDVWATLSTPAYCWYGNNISSKTPYGALYNWLAMNSGKLAPAGWHVASYFDWKKLITYAGGTEVAGGKLKEAGTAHWASPNKGATNQSGFTALPGGAHSARFNFEYQGESGVWWEYWDNPSPEGAVVYIMDYLYRGVIRTAADSRLDGHSVRCIKD